MRKMSEQNNQEYKFRPLERKDVAEAFNIIRSKKVFHWYGDHASFLRFLAHYLDPVKSHEKSLEDILEQVDVAPRTARKAREWPTLEYYVIEEQGKVIGVTGLYGDYYCTPNVLWIGWTGVRPDKQRKGIGTRMIQEIEKIAREREVDTLVVETDSSLEAANAFYRKNGFKEVGRIKQYHEGTEDLVIYVKNLK